MVVVEANETPIDDELDVDNTKHWDVIILDDAERTDALMVFYEAQAFWRLRSVQYERRQDYDLFAPDDLHDDPSCD